MPASNDELVAGTTIGEYIVENLLGQGGMGSVYAARHPVIGKRVAIKVLSYFFSRDASLVRRFTAEAQSVNKIGHPKIIDVFSFGKLSDGRHYFVMEYLEGETMMAWLERGRPGAGETKRFLQQTCAALEAAHSEGIVHRDLKPENIWIARPKHGEPYIKVLDFWLAKLTVDADVTSVTRTGAVMGTPQFMSPEQCVGRGVDHRTDVYAFGVILFRIFCGRFPFDAQSAAEIIAAQLYQKPPKPSTLANLPAGLEALILDCLDKTPTRRPASAAELARRLDAVLPTSAVDVDDAIAATLPPVSAAPETRPGFAPHEEELAKPESESAKPTRKGPSGWLVVAVVATGLLGAAAYLLLRPIASPNPVSPPALPAPVAPAPVAPVAPAPPVAVPAPAVGPPAAPVSAAAESKPGPAKVRRPTPTTPQPGKPSRVEREGLIQENPF